MCRRCERGDIIKKCINHSNILINRLKYIDMKVTMKRCSKCGAHYSSAYSICPECGHVDKWSVAMEVGTDLLNLAGKIITKSKK